MKAKFILIALLCVRHLDTQYVSHVCLKLLTVIMKLSRCIEQFFLVSTFKESRIAGLELFCFTWIPFCLAHPQNEIDQDEAVQDLDEDIELPDGKIGAKKRANLEAKAERKAQREVLYTEFVFSTEIMTQLYF